MVKLGQTDQATFEKLRDEIVGGDVNAVHLVKGLDYKLLERVRRGEDVISFKPAGREENDKDLEDEQELNNDVDEEFERLEEKEVKPMSKGEKSKEGELAPPAPVTGKKRTRDDILRELKESRAAAAEKAKQSQLGPKFVKLGEKKESSRIERDEKGKEILITVGEDGRVKRKVRKTFMDNNASNGHGLLMPDKDAKPLGMEVPTLALTPVYEKDDGDIFEGVGADYNPLGNMEDDEEYSDEDRETEAKATAESPKPSPPPKPSESETSAMPPPTGKKRNYFLDSIDKDETTNEPPPNPLTDPTILAALKKASTINPIPSSSANEEELAKLARRQKLLESHDRDAEDMDLEFGSSRFEDQEDDEDRKVKLSAWDGKGGEEGGRGEAKVKRKRSAKKRKGDIHSAADVLKVMERRKGESK